MYYRQSTARGVFAGLLMISAGTLPATAEERLNLSAANCIPRHSGQFEGNGVEGFKWDDAGIFSNGDDDDDQDLICAVPYDPLLRIDGRIPSVEVKVDVFDGHDSEAVLARLFRQDGNVAGVQVDSAQTPPGSGVPGTLTLTFNPTVTTRYVWFFVDVPDRDDARSGVRGYRVRRFLPPI